MALMYDSGSKNSSPPPASGGPEVYRDQYGIIWQKKWDPFMNGGLGGWTWEKVAVDPTLVYGDRGGGGSQPNYALQAAQAALQGFLSAQTLADARKAQAMENFQNLAKYAVAPGTEYLPGYEPGGLAHLVAAKLGLSEYHPPRLPTREISPADVAGEVPPEIMGFINRVLSAGGA